jgi:hypothetical protein
MILILVLIKNINNYITTGLGFCNPIKIIPKVSLAASYKAWAEATISQFDYSNLNYDISYNVKEIPIIANPPGYLGLAYQLTFTTPLKTDSYAIHHSITSSVGNNTNIPLF